MTCLMLISNYYCYDIPAALHQQFNDYMGSSDGHFETYFQLLYTVYSVPNVILPFFGGYFVDKFGVRVCLITFMAMLVIGQMVFAIGVGNKSWTLMFLGRVLYGFGGESLSVANSAVLSEWFKGKELAFAFGLNLSIARLGSVANNFVSPRLASGVSIDFACWFGVILTGVGLLSTVAISVIDKAFDTGADGVNQPLIAGDDEEEDRITKKNPVSHDIEGDTVNYDEDILASFGAPEKLPPPEMKDVLKFSQAFWLLAISCVVVYGCVLPFNNIASTLLLERSYFQSPESDCSLTFPTECQSTLNIPLTTCDLYYDSSTNQPPLPAGNTTSSIDCSSFLASDGSYSGCYSVYCTRLGDAIVQSTETMSIPYFISAGLSPFLGAAVDRYGQRAVIAALSPGILVLVHLALGLSTMSPVLPLVGQGLAYAGFAAVLWPSVPLVIEQRFVGLGFGIVTSIQNAGLASFPLIVATIYAHSGDKYIPNVEWFFVGLASCGFAIGVYLNFYDYNHNRVFNSPGSTGADTEAKSTGRTLSVDPASRTVIFQGDHHAGERAARTNSTSRNSVDNKSRNVFSKVKPVN